MPSNDTASDKLTQVLNDIKGLGQWNQDADDALADKDK